MENFGVRADIVCMAKALGGGLPLGATLSSSSIMDWPPGTHSNTFGGNLLASAASLAALNFMEREEPDGSIDQDTRDRIVVEGFKEGIVLLLWRHYGVGKVEFGKPAFN